MLRNESEEQVFPKPFDYAAPATLPEALDLLRRYGENARVLAGGQSLIPLMKLRFLELGNVIDLRRIAELRGIEEEQGEIRCGAMVRHSEIERSGLIAHRIPLLSEVAAEIADVQVRNRGTIGGALCQADPAGDWAVACLALAARMRCVGPGGKRVIPASAFFTDTYTTALAPEEILIDVLFPVPMPDSVGVYVKIRKRSGDFSIASVALQARMSAEGRCDKAGVGIGGVAPTPLAPQAIAEFLTGKTMSEEVIQETCAMLPQYLDPIDDLRGSAGYKRSVAAVALERALRLATERARRKTDK